MLAGGDAIAARLQMMMPLSRIGIDVAMTWRDHF
jgi:hypothetical protein